MGIGRTMRRAMSRTIGRAPVVVLVGVGAMAAAVVPPLLGPSAASLISDSPKEVIDQTWQIVFRDYLDTTGKYTPEKWRTLRKSVLTKSYGSTKESYEAIRGMLGSLDDPYTRFLDPREFKEMQIDTSGELSGVGIQLSLDKETKELVVVSPIEGSKRTTHWRCSWQPSSHSTNRRQCSFRECWNFIPTTVAPHCWCGAVCN